MEKEALEDPSSVCADIITTPNQFSLYSDAMKAETCTRTIEELDAQNARSLAQSVEAPDRCGLIVSQVYQSYGWFLQDLNDLVIAALTKEMNDMLQYQSDYYKAHKEQEDVAHFLRLQEENVSVADETLLLYNQIQNLNAVKTAEAAQQA